MAEVFLARQTGMKGFEKVVVIKRILPHLAMQERFVQMFLDEARLAARFNHPNIVQIYDLGEENGSYYIAMEYINGEDLRSVVKACAARSERIPMEHVVKIISAVLDGLHYAHQQADLEGRRKGIVHRDVSPHNIIVSFEGGVKLVDFGIARARSEISTTIPGRVKGKHAYMSPEQCQGLELDCRSDIFSAGIVLYEL
ncbi:MAG: serine/threonine protein kinase, partial [Deltaproteobacteria bacterium]